MLVTLLVLTSATALGIIAAYSTASEVQTSGTVRASAQSEYMSDYAARLGRDIASSYVPQILSGSNSRCPELFCSTASGCVPVTGTVYVEDFFEVETMGTGRATDVVAPNIGSFGLTPVWAWGSITFDDLIQRPVMVAGQQMNDPETRPIDCHFRMAVDGSTIGVANPAAGLDDPHVNTQRVRAFGRVTGL